MSIRLMGLIFAIFAFSALSVRGQEPPTAPTSTQPGVEPGSSSDTSEAETVPEVPPGSTTYRVIKFAGKFHLLLLHFPIAFLFAATLVQWYWIVTGRGEGVAPMLLWFGAVGAVAAAALGWMYAYDSVYFGDDENLLFWHRWLGTGTAVAATVVVLLKNRLGPKTLAVALTLCATLVAAAAHFGASLVYGAGFLKKL
jgi:hypothetical protein